MRTTPTLQKHKIKTYLNFSLALPKLQQLKYTLVAHVCKLTRKCENLTHCGAYT